MKLVGREIMEMSHQVRAVTALAEDLGSTSSTHVVAHVVLRPFLTLGSED